jgi:hypothetical protein
MLTRTSHTSDFAPDASVFPHGKDRETGGRKLEELAFEIVSKQRVSRVNRTARLLRERGVRRVFAIDVKKERALEWSTTTNSWQILPSSGVIEDRALVRPLPIEALVTATVTDDAVALALLAKENRVLVDEIQRHREDGERVGTTRATANAILAVLAARGIATTTRERARVRATSNPARLDELLARAATCRTTRELFVRVNVPLPAPPSRSSKSSSQRNHSNR